MIIKELRNVTTHVCISKCKLEKGCVGRSEASRSSYICWQEHREPGAKTERLSLRAALEAGLGQATGQTVCTLCLREGPASGQGCAQLNTAEQPPGHLQGKLMKGVGLPRRQSSTDLLSTFIHSLFHARTGGCHEGHREEGSVLALRSSWHNGGQG